MKKTLIFYLLVSCTLMNSCVSRKVAMKSKTNPLLTSLNISSMAILPLRNDFMQKENKSNYGNAVDGIMITDLTKINGLMYNVFQLKNPNIKITDAISASECLNKNNLIKPYDTLLSTFDNTGMPITRIMNDIGNKLGVDAILQGFTKSTTQFDKKGHIPHVSVTGFVVRYVLFSTKTGDILWESNFAGAIANKKKTAPTIEEVISLIQPKLLPEIPLFKQ